MSDLIEGEAKEDPEPGDGHDVVGRAGRDNNGRYTLKGNVQRFHMGGPWNHLQLRNTVYFKSFSFFKSLWPIRTI